MTQEQPKKQYRIEDNKIIRTIDDLVIEEGTVESKAYLYWLAQGNTPEGLDDIV